MIRRAAVALAAVALAAVLAAPAGAATVHVFDGDSIQDAVKAADPGDEVVVHPGTYRESISIKTNHLTLRGAGDRRGGTVIKPGSDKRCDGGRIGICILTHKTSSGHRVPTKDTRITGFRIQGFKDFGAGAFGARDTLFRNNTFVHNDEYGMAAFESKGTQVLHSVAKHAEEAGFYIGDSVHSGAILRGNRARRNHQLGFFIRDASHGVMRHNQAIQNCIGVGLLNTGAPGGVQHWRVSDNRVLRNQRRCGGGGGPDAVSGTGIALFGARGNLIRDNVVRGNRPTGSAVFPGGIVIVSSIPFGGSNAAHNRIAHNRAFKNQPADIIWDGNGQGNTFVQNRCGSSQPDGLCD
jgi:nitrous oxidase accessory protein NosD